MTWVLFGFDFGTGVSSIFAIPLHEALGLPKFLSQFIAEFGIDIFDKVLTVIAAFAVLKSIPTRFLAKLPLGRIYIKDEDLALDEEDEE